MGKQRDPARPQSKDVIVWGRKVLRAMTPAPMVKNKTNDRGKWTTKFMRLALESIMKDRCHGMKHHVFTISHSLP